MRREATRLGESDHKLRSKVHTGLIKFVDNEKRFAVLRIDNSKVDSSVSFDRLLPVPIPKVPKALDRTGASKHSPPTKASECNPAPSASPEQNFQIPPELEDHPALKPNPPAPPTHARRRSPRLNPVLVQEVNALERDALYPHLFKSWRIVSFDKITDKYRVRWTNLGPTEDTYEYARYCLLYTSPSPRDKRQSRMPSSA